MKTYTFNLSVPIQDFQFLTDSSGILLDETGGLYRFHGNEILKINTPATFQISASYFIDEQHGAIIGNGGILKNEVQQGSVGSSGMLIVFFLLLLGTLKNRQLQKYTWVMAVLLLCLTGVLGSCSTKWQSYKTPDPDSPNSTLILNDQLSTGWSPHTYSPNKGQTSFIAITENGGQDWLIHKVPTNFFLTALTAIGKNYIVGTFANEHEGTIPLHGDGDLYFFGHDTAGIPRLAENKNDKPASLDVKRGVNGLTFSHQDSTLYVYGTETMPLFPKNEISTSPGNIFAIPADLKPPYRIIDAPDAASVTSLTRSGMGELWVTLDNKKEVVRDRRAVYQKLPDKKLLRFTAGEWQEVSISGASSFEQVAFVPETAVGYALSEQGSVFVSTNGGNSWEQTALTEIRKVKTLPTAVAFLQGEQTLIRNSID